MDHSFCVVSHLYGLFKILFDLIQGRLWVGCGLVFQMGFFDKLYAVMNEQEKRQVMESLISEIQIYPERQENGQWLKSIKFKLPIIEEDMNMSLDNDTYIESVALLTKEDK